MRILIIIEAFIMIVLFVLSKDKYKEELIGAESKEYKLLQLMPISMFLLDVVGYKFSGRYDKKISKSIANLYGAKSASLHVRLFYSYKLTAMVLIMTLLTFFGALAEKVEHTYIGFTLLSPLMIFYILDKELEAKLQKRDRMIRTDFPDVVSKLVLLVNAGMTLNRAWEKICTDTKKDTPLYRELKTTYQQIQAGKPESEAYEEFAKRCRVKEITKFITLIIQNLKKGSGDLVPLLKLEADECWEMRKSRAKQLGDEASSKLIIPMMIMFIGILIIVVLPAVLQLNSL